MGRNGTIGKITKEEFADFVSEKRIEVFEKLSDVCPESASDLKIGDKVTFTNDYGCVFENKTIMGFCKDWLEGRHVYIDSDCYWFPKSIESLTKE